ncbi:uncharacterized protein KQ657_004383 [Scheffersomyces spartinae]|uniref:Mitochondrial thiamine pyrophosphate carrier 1 n=1 Tax=Scheffersomyces spartinae TaxID=45513 RepID=A0A9P7VBY5_9ASCO|nr:uncharacterized protein KQ657_004383 [Scheffersomyces spartinae]KAG7194706.1 hypothetical protein KQ657_004383 [Scheffersomyces spartinae]
MSSSSNEGESLLTALVSGTTAAAFAATVTYPFDCIKTQEQLNNKKLMAKYSIPGNYPGSLAQLFKGGSALVLGSVLKNSARLISYNWLTQFMAIDTADGKRKTSAPRMVIASIISGFLETLWIIPFENIKITMVQNMTLNNELIRCEKEKIAYDITGSKLPHIHKPAIQYQYISPHAYWTSEILSQFTTGKVSKAPITKFLAHGQGSGATPSGSHQVGSGHHYSGGHVHKMSKLDLLRIHYNKNPSLTFVGTINEMYKMKGVRAFTSGSIITFVRQIGISGIWLSTYNATRQLIDPHSTNNNWFGHQHTVIQLFGLHLLSSVAVVAVTQPLDVIKTHMQLKNGKFFYKDSLKTALNLVVQQGPVALFKGSLPRGFKIVINGGLTAALYNYVERLVNVAGEQILFTD